LERSLSLNSRYTTGRLLNLPMIRGSLVSQRDRSSITGTASSGRWHFAGSADSTSSTAMGACSCLNLRHCVQLGLFPSAPRPILGWVCLSLWLGPQRFLRPSLWAIPPG